MALHPSRPDITQVWAILEEECGADKERGPWSAFSEFAMQWPACGEYRFGGDLGYGGKVLYQRGSLSIQVSCYPEDLDDEKLAIIRRTNKRLATEVSYTSIVAVAEHVQADDDEKGEDAHHNPDAD